MKTRILFINAIDIAKSIETSNPPLGLAYLASALREKIGFSEVEIKIIDRDVERVLREFKPDIVGLSAVSQNYKRALAYADAAKVLGLPVICGGVHVSMLQSSLSRSMDVGVVGEGEHTICELVSLFRDKAGFPKEELKKIKGIIFWENMTLVGTEKREPVQPLDLIQYPARDLIEIKNNTFMFTGRGCLYRCSFCASSRFWGKIRLHSAQYVVQEVRELYEKYGVKHISFLDDLFSADVARVREIITLLKKDGLLGKIKFTCSIRANKVDEEIAGLFRELGVVSVGMGLESGSGESLRYLKGGVTVEENYRAVEIIRRFGMQVFGSFVIGSPGEDKAEILKTLDFIKKSRVDGFGVYVLTPFPGTPVWDYAAGRGLVGLDMDWGKLSVDFAQTHESAIILSEKLSRTEIYRLWLLFEKYRARKHIMYLLAQGLLHPWRIPGYLCDKIKTFRSKK